MKVLVLHYHLKRGGVGTVIRRQLACLRSAGIETCLLLGEVPDEPPPGDWLANPALAYDSVYLAAADSGAGSSGTEQAAGPERVERLVACIESACGQLAGKQTLIHVHNPTIRKNSALLPALRLLAQGGYRLLLQVHDVAEDWRPDVYPAGEYPDGCWWAAINRRDCRNFATASGSPVFFLPNPVMDPDAPAPSQDGVAGGEDEGKSEKLYLYPVRGIRRKNLGEALLLASWLPDSSYIGVTLPPNNPADFDAYEHWRRLAREYALPVRFGLGSGRTLDGLYAATEAVVSTSVKEGFGLSFLEPAARGKAVCGRSIPAIVEDFSVDGLDFSRLYSRIGVPVSFYDAEAFRSRMRAVVRRALALYGCAPGLGGLVLELAERSWRGLVDFGRLDELAQSEVLGTVAEDAEKARVLAEDNPCLESWWRSEQRVPAPAPEVLRPWTPEAYLERLVQAYSCMEQGRPSPPPDRKALLALYLVPDTLSGVGVSV